MLLTVDVGNSQTVLATFDGDRRVGSWRVTTAARATADELRAAVALVGDLDVELEATGGLTLAVAREVADTGVDYLSVGGLTHSSPILDLALDLRKG